MEGGIWLHDRCVYPCRCRSGPTPSGAIGPAVTPERDPSRAEGQARRSLGPSRSRRKWGPRVAAAAMVVTLVGCGSSSPSKVSATRVPLPAGRLPSDISKMVCAPEAQREIAAALGVTAYVQTPTWSGHLYSCRYTYPNGAFVLSVKELSSWAQTFAYFRGIRSRLGDTTTLHNLGQGGFVTRGGSVAVRKDWKVLLVDISGLPSQFGKPPTPSFDVSVTIADVILGCWSGD